ncbi:MAG TPA: hypothetical protein VG291_03955 [Xanthobacteraceae bacterium]|nr:hypothetical protein [Xanthobacteraceae bacterium]
MPTTLPDSPSRAARRRRPLLAELASIAVAIFYLLLLAWNMASLETSFSLRLGHDQRQGEHNREYNPMEPDHPTSERRAAAQGAH